MAKIAIYVPELNKRGGADKALLEYLKKTDHTVELYTHSYEPDQTFNEFQDFNVSTIGLKKCDSKILNFLVYPTLTKIPPNEHDALIVWSSGFAEPVKVRNRDIPSILVCLTPERLSYDPKYLNYELENSGIIKKQLYNIFSSFYPHIESRLWKKFNKIIFISKNVKKRASSNHIFKDIDTSIIHIGVSPQKPSEQYGDFFFYPSRLEPYKRQKLAIESFVKFQQISDTDMKLVIGGGLKNRNRDYYQSLQEITSENNDIEIKKNIENEEWERLYRECYTTLFMAVNEDWGLVPLESMSYGKPVISVDEGGPQEYIENGKNGFLVEAEPERIAERMKKLASDSLRVKRMGEKSKETSRNYTTERFIKELDQKVEEVIRE